MKIEVILVTFGIKALNEDENYIEKPEVEAYLNSPRWEWQKSQRSILCGITHYFRNDPGSEEGLGASDKLFKDGTILGCLIDSWISKDGKRWEGTLEIFDDLDEYSDEQKSQILQLLRLLKHGVSVPVSCCIFGDWSDDDGKLIFLDTVQGVDFTLQPAFFGSGVIPETIEK